MELEILYHDDHLVAINKPHGLLVHRSKFASDAKQFAMQELRNQLGRHVYPCHRLDRKTSGVLVFALEPEINGAMQKQFAAGNITKTYLTIVRGYTNEQGTINYPLTNEDEKTQEAITHYQTLQQTEIEVPSGNFGTSRYSLVKVMPDTGRMHQIRKHFAHIFHPIIGDRPHGCNKQNRLVKEKWNITTMMLHAYAIEFKHPVSGKATKITAPLSGECIRFMKILGLNFNDYTDVHRRDDVHT